MGRALFLAPVILAAMLACVVGGALLVSHSPGFAALLVLGILLAGLTFFAPKAGLVILVLMMLFSPEVSVGQSAFRQVTLRGDDIIVLLIAMGWLGQVARRKEGPILRWTPLNLPIFCMAGVIVISGLVNVVTNNVSVTNAAMFGAKRLEYFLVFFMVTSILRDWNDVKAVLPPFLGACAIISVIGIVQFFAFPGTELVAGGVTSTFGLGEANTLGGFSLMVFCVSFGLATGVKAAWHRWALMGLCVLSALCLVLTYSRGAYVALAFSLLALLIFDRTWRLWKYLLWYGVPAVGLLALVVMVGEMIRAAPVVDAVDTVQSQVASLVDVATKGPTADPSMRARWIAWDEAIDHFKQHPVLGMGVGSRSMGWYDSHWFRELAETGLAGILVFLWLQLSAFRLVFGESRKAEGALKGAALGLLGAQVGLWVHGLSAENFYTIRTTEPFFFLLGLIAVGHLHRLEEAAAAEPARGCQHAPT